MQSPSLVRATYAGRLLHLPVNDGKTEGHGGVGPGERWRGAFHARIGMEESLGGGRIIFMNLVHCAQDAARGNTQYVIELVAMCTYPGKSVVHNSATIQSNVKSK